MRRYLLSALLFVSLPAFATISYVRSAATWNGAGFSTCQVSLGTTNNPDLLAVWTYWRTSSANTLTASAEDSLTHSPYASAVGPTVQSASDTAAQIFYFPNVGTSMSGDTITVTFSGSAGVSSGCVVAEFSGADTQYPLDSVSAGYSTSGNPTGLLDSGTVAPANANLLVFGGGTTDYTGSSVGAGTGFTAVQSNVGSITEQMIVSGNNTLQRATAGYPSPPPTGHWVMQMAIFRDASWTVFGGWSPIRADQVQHTDQFPGTTPTLQIQGALASVYADIGNGQYNPTTTTSTFCSPGTCPPGPGIVTIPASVAQPGQNMVDYGAIKLGSVLAKLRNDLITIHVRNPAIDRFFPQFRKRPSVEPVSPTIIACLASAPLLEETAAAGAVSTPFQIGRVRHPKFEPG